LKHGNLARENVGRHLQRAILTVVFTSGRSRGKSAPAVTYYVPLYDVVKPWQFFSDDYNGRFIHARGALSATVMVSFLRKRDGFTVGKSVSRFSVGKSYVCKFNRRIVIQIKLDFIIHYGFCGISERQSHRPRIGRVYVKRTKMRPIDLHARVV